MNHIEIAGTSYPISFGYGALMEYETITGASAISLFSQVQKGNVGITELITLLACGLQNGADETGDPRPFTPKAVARMLDKEPDVEGVFAATMKFLEKLFCEGRVCKKKDSDDAAEPGYTSQSELTDWNRLFEMAGRMGMSEKEFLHTTPRYFYFRQKGFEGLQNEYWQRTRLESFYAFLPHAKKNAMRKPSDLFKLPGDEVEFTYSEQEKAALLEHLSRAKSVDFFTGESQNAQA